MIDSLIGRSGSKLRGCFRTLGATGATTLAVLIGTMALSSAPALAAGPEAPNTEPTTGITATTATLNGVVNPAASSPVEEGTWEFLYKATSTISQAECESVGASKAPLSPGAYAGLGPEAFSEAVTGLTADTEYVVCLRVEGNMTKEATVGPAVAFKTAVVPQKPVTSSPAKLITATTAELEGELNPTKEAETGYHFVYSTEPTCAAAGTETESVAPAAVPAKTKVTATVTGLQPHQKYVFCLVATNTAEPPEAAQSTNEVKFETLAAPPEIPSEIIPALVNSPVIADAGGVNPNNQTTTCHVQYGEKLLSEEIEHEVPCEPPSLTGFGEQQVGVTLTELNPGAKYHYRIVAKNEKAEETQGGEAEFETVALPTELITGAAEAVTTTSAELGGKLNPGGEATYYIEYGTAPCSGSSCGVRTAELQLGGSTQQKIEPPFAVTGLEPHTTYHYWLVATNAVGTVHGEAREFTTDLAPSQIEIGSVEAVTTTSAELTGALNPGGEATYYIEYGPAQCSGATSTCGTKTAGVVVTGETQQSIAPIVLSGLQPNTVYHYWLVGTNAAETVHGVAGAFKTVETQAEVATEKAAASRAEAEVAAEAAAQSKLAAEAQSREAAANAVAAAQSKQYNEILAVTAANERHEAEEKRVEELIAATSAKITKTKVGTRSVVVTIDVTQAGTVTISGTGLKSKTEKVTVGEHSITVTLTSAGKKDRKHHKKVTITAALETSLTSVSGSTTVKL